MQASQTQNMDIDLTRGHKEYDSKVKNIEGIFAKVSSILDISKYREEFAKILKEAENDSNFSVKLPYSNLQMDYEDFIYDTYYARLDKLAQALDCEVLPFYELYLLSNDIQKKLSDISGENIGDVIGNTKKLIDSLNKLNTHNKKDENNIINLAYKTIYMVIKYEVLFDRHDILSYVKKLNIPVNIESIGRLLSDDLRMLDKSDLMKVDLEHIKTDGLGYDYLDEEIIDKVSSRTVGKKDSEYQARKRDAIERISDEIDKLNEAKNDLSESLNSNKNNLKKLKMKKRILVTKMLSLAMIPVVTISAGHAIGKAASNRITEYKTVTRTVDANTGKVIGTLSEVYDEHATTYVATILEQGPWRVNQNGGYIRTVTAYEYITPEGIAEDYHVSLTDLDNNLREKYKYLEAKEILDDADSMTESTLLITETYQDKNDSRVSEKYIIPFTMIGGFVALFIDLAVLLIRTFGYENAKVRLAKLNEEIAQNKLDNEQIKERVIELMNLAVYTQKEYNDAVRKYGSLGDKFIFEDIDTKDIKSFTKSLTLKNK